MPPMIDPGLALRLQDPGVQAMLAALLRARSAQTQRQIPDILPDLQPTPRTALPMAGPMAAALAAPVARLATPPPAAMPAQGQGLAMPETYGGDYATAGWGTAQPFDYAAEARRQAAVRRRTQAAGVGAGSSPYYYGGGGYQPRPSPYRVGGRY